MHELHINRNAFIGKQGRNHPHANSCTTGPLRVQCVSSKNEEQTGKVKQSGQCLSIKLKVNEKIRALLHKTKLTQTN